MVGFLVNVFNKDDEEKMARHHPRLPRNQIWVNLWCHGMLGVRSGAVSWEGAQLSCSPTCSRMYCWQKQQGRSRDSPAHSRPHERMMVDYLQEMSYSGPPESQDNTLVQRSSTFQMTEGKNGKLSREIIHLFFPPLYCQLFSKSVQKIGPHAFKGTQTGLFSNEWNDLFSISCARLSISNVLQEAGLMFSGMTRC